MIGGQTISGFVIAYNEQARIGDCLESMKWADELVVVDSYSTDATVEIARRYTDKIVQRQFDGHVGQTAFAFSQVTGDWVLWLDADERLTPQAADEVRRELERPGGPAYDAFAFPRKTMYLGRWITHGGWYPQHKVRLARRAAGRVAGGEPHPELTVDGRVKMLAGDILHLSFPGGVMDYARRSLSYADIAARTRFAQGRRAGWTSILLKPVGAFLKSYVLKRGFLDGVPGLAVGMGTAFHRFTRELRLWELGREGSDGRAGG